MSQSNRAAVRGRESLVRTPEPERRQSIRTRLIDLRARPLALLLCLLLLASVSANGPALDLGAFERARVLRAADAYLAQPPITIVAASSPRSQGGRHDFFSEGDYWWPDPADPQGPYVQRDGLSNPDNFTAHREALMRLSVQVPALAAAWKLTDDTRYAAHAARHLRAWFIDPDTRMNPHLKFAQAIHGRVSGRGIGIIDTIHLVEVARTVEVIEPSGALSPDDLDLIRRWFADYLRWMTTHPYGIDERDTTNNHATCWVMQVAAYARLTGDAALQAYARERFRTVLVPGQMAPDGSFPRELTRTKPYAYSLFNLEALATVAQILSTPDDNLWTFTLPDGRGLARAVAYMAPFIADKSAWPLPPDVMHDDEWPMRQNSLLFAGLALERPDYIDLWKRLRPDSGVQETVRNFFIRQPVLWIAGGSRHGGSVRPTSALAAPAGAQEPPHVDVSSPNGSVRLRIVRNDAGLQYAVAMREQPVIEPSNLGIVIDGQDWGRDAAIGAVERYRVDERYPWRGVHAEAVNRCEGARLRLRRVSDGREFTVDVRVFDDGVGVRYVVPGKNSENRVPDAAMTFRLPAGSDVWSHDFDRGHYEGMHVRRAIEDVRQGEWAAPPLTVRLPGGHGYAAITEAGLRGYAGMALQGSGERTFREVLGHAVPASYPFRLRYEADIGRMTKPAAMAGTITTPWRVILAGADLHTLVVSDILHNLSAPPDPALFPEGMQADWIRPGRAVWKYLDGGENTLEEMKEFSRLAGELGFEYHVVEGFWRKWTPEQLRELVAFSRARGVGIWLWQHSNQLLDADSVRRFFAMCRDAGVVGAKVDFFDHEAKEVIERYELVLREAARHRILINFHGANKPTGEPRTWPNEMTREGVYGLEYGRTEVWATHNATLPFTRYLAGHGDYTPVIFGERRRETSWAHQIATAAVFTSPLLVYGAHPASLLENPAVDVIKSIPASWDETVVLPTSEIGEIAALARRSGETWFVAILNGAEERTVRLPLSFADAGGYRATLVRDDPERPDAVRIERGVPATRQDTIEIVLRPGGGFIGRFEAVPGPDASAEEGTAR